MAQAGDNSNTRRSLVGKIILAPVAAALPSEASPSGSAQGASSDATFQAWWLEMYSLERQIEIAPQETDADQYAIDQMADRAGDLQDLILQTRSSSRFAAELKLRTLIGYFGNYDAVVVAPAKDILSFIRTLG